MSACVRVPRWQDAVQHRAEDLQPEQEPQPRPAAHRQPQGLPQPQQRQRRRRLHQRLLAHRSVFPY